MWPGRLPDLPHSDLCQECRRHGRDRGNRDPPDLDESDAPRPHPITRASVKANNLTPEYRFWNGYSTNYSLRDAAQLDPKTGAYPTSRPDGTFD